MVLYEITYADEKDLLVSTCTTWMLYSMKITGLSNYFKKDKITILIVLKNLKKIAKKRM